MTRLRSVHGSPRRLSLRIVKHVFDTFVRAHNEVRYVHVTIREKAQLNYWSGNFNSLTVVKVLGDGKVGRWTSCAERATRSTRSRPSTRSPGEGISKGRSSKQRGQFAPPHVRRAAPAPRAHHVACNRRLVMADDLIRACEYLGTDMPLLSHGRVDVWYRHGTPCTLLCFEWSSTVAPGATTTTNGFARAGGRIRASAATPSTRKTRLRSGETTTTSEDRRFKMRQAPRAERSGARERAQRPQEALGRSGTPSTPREAIGQRLAPKAAPRRPGKWSRGEHRVAKLGSKNTDKTVTAGPRGRLQEGRTCSEQDRPPPHAAEIGSGAAGKTASESLAA